MHGVVEFSGRKNKLTAVRLLKQGQKYFDTGYNRCGIVCCVAITSSVRTLLSNEEKV